MRYFDIRDGDRIRLGQQGENLARTMIFDVSDWLAAYGPGVVRSLVRRPRDAVPYDAPVTQTADAHVEWVVTAVDTSFVGSGQFELQYYVGDTLAKSSVWTFSVSPSLGGEVGPQPDPWEAMAERVQRDAAAAETARVSAETAQREAEAAQAAAESAQGAAEDAQSLAEHAQESSEAAARVSAESMEQSRDARDASRRYADLAEQSASTSGWIYVDGEADGHLYLYKADTVNNITMEDQDGRLIVIYD